MFDGRVKWKPRGPLSGSTMKYMAYPNNQFVVYSLSCVQRRGQVDRYLGLSQSAAGFPIKSPNVSWVTWYYALY